MAGGGVAGELLAPRTVVKLTLLVSRTQLLLLLEGTDTMPVLLPPVDVQLAAQEAFELPPEPLQLQVYWPLAEATTEAVPAVHRFAEGTNAKICPLALPHVPAADGKTGATEFVAPDAELAPALLLAVTVKV